jgi:hypothetical protein
MPLPDQGELRERANPKALAAPKIEMIAYRDCSRRFRRKLH